MVVKHVKDDNDYAQEFAASAGKILIVDFFATWCGPCRTIAPIFEQLSNQYPAAKFLKVDVDKCHGTAQRESVSAMPTFLFFQNKIKVDQMRGANPQELAAKVQKWAPLARPDSGDACSVGGYMDLTATMLDKSRCECSNEDNRASLRAMFDGSSPLKSDADEQLIINLQFSQVVKIHSFRIKGPPSQGPKTIKVFINHPITIDFDRAEKTEPTQNFELTHKNLEGEPFEVRFVLFQNVQNVQIFVVDNQSSDDVTIIDDIKVFGKPLQTTNMSDFKRVAGNVGEGHV